MPSMGTLDISCIKLAVNDIVFNILPYAFKICNVDT